MLSLSGGTRIFICNRAVDLRKGFEGLSLLVESSFAQNVVTSTAYFVFLNKSRDRMKVLYWDNDGLAIWLKRLEKGRFPKRKHLHSQMDRREFLMLLEGVVPRRLHKRYKS